MPNWYLAYVHFTDNTTFHRQLYFVCLRLFASSAAAADAVVNRPQKKTTATGLTTTTYAAIAAYSRRPCQQKMRSTAALFQTPHPVNASPGQLQFGGNVTPAIVVEASHASARRHHRPRRTGIPLRCGERVAVEKCC